jgi:hypothetical protein
LLRQTHTRGHLAGRWVTADEWYKRGSEFWDELDTDGGRYVLQVPLDLEVFTQPAQMEVTQRTDRGASGGGRAWQQAVRAPSGRYGAGPVGCCALDDTHSGRGHPGPLTYQFAALRGWESRDGLPGREGWLVLRRNQDGSEGRCYLSNAPAETGLWTLA